MALRKRFNPVDFYRRAAKPLSVAAPKTKFRSSPTAPLSTVGHFFDKAAPLIADYITAEREKEIRSADQANVEKMIEALTAPRTAYDPDKYGTSSKDLMVAAEGYTPEDGGIGDEQILSSEAQREFYTEEADRVRKAYETGEPAGADLVRQQAAAGAYNMPTQSNWLAEQFGAEPPKERMTPRASDLMMKILLGDKTKKDAAELLSGERAYKKEVAKALAASKLAAARAKPPSTPTRYKEWKLSGSKLSFEKWMEKDDWQKQGLRPGPGGQPTAIPGGSADIKQQRIKLQETSTALLRRKVELMEQKLDPDYIAKIEQIRKSEAYLIDLKKSRPKARGAVNTLKMKGEKVAAIVADALPLAESLWSAGPGAMFSSVWNTDSRKLAGLLTNLRAIIGFDTLAEMRANSPTGGALGQVSNIEINLLQAVQGTLDQGQQELLIRSLTDIKGNYPRLLSWAEERFKEQYAPLGKQPGSKRKVIRLDAEGNVIP